MDRWDAVGGLGATLIGAGVGRLAGWPWASIYFGGLLLALYILHEVRR
jgi:hypothetical protein